MSAIYVLAKCRESGRMSVWEYQLQIQGGRLGIIGVVWCWMASLWTNPEAVVPKKRDLSGSWKLPTSFLGQGSRNRGSMGAVEWEHEGHIGTSTGFSAKSVSRNGGVSPGLGPFGVFSSSFQEARIFFFNFIFCGILFPLLSFNFTSFLDLSFHLFKEMKYWDFN